MVNGVAALHRRFAKIPKAIVKVIEDELDTVGPQLVSEMLTLVPEDEGELRASIGYDRSRRNAGSFSVAFLRSGTAYYALIGITLYAGKGLPKDPKWENYAIYQEFGTKNMPANPYFFPVWRSNRTRIKSRLTRAINRKFKEL